MHAATTGGAAGGASKAGRVLDADTVASFPRSVAGSPESDARAAPAALSTPSGGGGHGMAAFFPLSAPPRAPGVSPGAQAQRALPPAPAPAPTPTHAAPAALASASAMRTSHPLLFPLPQPPGAPPAAWRGAGALPLLAAGPRPQLQLPRLQPAPAASAPAAATQQVRPLHYQTAQRLGLARVPLAALSPAAGAAAFPFGFPSPAAATAVAPHSIIANS
jgi:hypothetical protein